MKCAIANLQSFDAMMKYRLLNSIYCISDLVNAKIIKFISDVSMCYWLATRFDSRISSIFSEIGQELRSFVISLLPADMVVTKTVFRERENRKDLQANEKKEKIGKIPIVSSDGQETSRVRVNRRH